MTPNPLIARLRDQSPQILPSMLLCDFTHLAGEVEQLASADIQVLHLDVMDGHFVPNFTYGMPIVAALRQLTDMVLDVHLMISEPDRYLDAFREAGADILTVHVEATTDPCETLERIRATGAAAGLALNPDTPLKRITPYLDQCDLVLTMSVPAGFGGQAFHPAALEKLEWLKEHAPHAMLEVDGGVSPDTIEPCAAAGAELLVVGSAIFRQPDYASAIRNLQTQAANAAQ